MKLWSPEFWLALLALFAVTVATAQAHSWYDPACCDERDCRPIDAKHISITPQGYRIEIGALKVTVPLGDIRPSQDADYHVCTYHLTGPGAPTEKLRWIKERACLYVPLGF